MPLGNFVAKEDVSIHELVGALYRVLLGREPDEEGLRNFIDQYRSDSADVDQLISSIMLSAEFKYVALSHPRIAEAALELALPLLTGCEPTKDVVDLLGGRLVKMQKMNVMS